MRTTTTSPCKCKLCSFAATGAVTTPLCAAWPQSCNELTVDVNTATSSPLLYKSANDDAGVTSATTVGVTVKRPHESTIGAVFTEMVACAVSIKHAAPPDVANADSVLVSNSPTRGATATVAVVVTTFAGCSSAAPLLDAGASSVGAPRLRPRRAAVVQEKHSTSCRSTDSTIC
jgi:hypothetical protein